MTIYTIYNKLMTINSVLKRFNSWEGVNNEILGVSQAMRTDVADVSRALKLANRMFGIARGGAVPKALFIVTDTESNEDTMGADQQRIWLIERGVEINTIGINLRVRHCTYIEIIVALNNMIIN